MEAAGKLDEAVGMQQRALSLSVEAVGEADATSLDVCYRLAQLQVLAGNRDAAASSLQQWRRGFIHSGGDASEATRRCDSVLEQA